MQCFNEAAKKQAPEQAPPEYRRNPTEANLWKAPSDEKIAEIKHEMQFVDPDAPDTPKG